MIGRSIAHYRVTELLGKGGMGEVFRARDSRLNRDVALKVLPEEFARDAHRMARFEREAQVLASLNHPQIASVYGLEESDGTRALVMELVEGPTLAERIALGRVPLEETLAIARQIVEALEYAHDKSVIHRDLKPANIKLSREGKVKILDFGLAKALADDSGAQDASSSPTLTDAATRAGMILGTAAYMSPEQAKGKSADRRADIWAFGCVLFEMLTGKQTFVGEATTEVLAAVLRAEPAWNTLPPGTPPAIRRLLRRALQKDPHLRLHSIADARLDLEETGVPPDGAMAPAAAVTSGSRWKLVPWAVAALLLLSLVGVLLKGGKPAVTNPVTRFSFGENVSLFFARSLAISPDGKQLAFVYEIGGLDQVYLRSLDRFQAEPLRGATLAREPFFSPDGKWLGFISSDLKIRKYSYADGTVSAVCECGANSASWGDTDRIVFSQIAKLAEISAAGGPIRELAALDPSKGEAAFYSPTFLPGGKAVLFTRFSLVGAQGLQPKHVVEALSLADKQRKILVENASSPIYSSTGHLLFHRDGAMLAAPFDPERLELTGSPVRVLDGVSVGGDGSMKAALSSNGVLIYASPEVSELVWVDRAGRFKPLRQAPGTYSSPRLSPDGTRLAVADGGSVWVLDLLRQTYSLLTVSSFDRPFPTWTRDSSRIVLTGQHLAWKRADGTGELEILIREPAGRKIPASVSPDGKELALVVLGTATTGSDLYIVNLEGEKKARPFLQGSAYEGGGQFSPDGKLMAYVSDESGRREVYVTPYPGAGSRWQVSSDGGTHPLWNPNGQELFYRNGGRTMAVKISESPRFSASKPQLLFEGNFAFGAGTTIPNYSVTRDGQSFVMVRVPPGQEASIHVVVNWFEELRRALGAGAR